MEDFNYWEERKNIERDLPIAYEKPTAYEQQLALLQLIKSIRNELKPGYTVSGWSPTLLCVTYCHAGPDSRQRYFVKNADEWTALKARLGL